MKRHRNKMQPQPSRPSRTSPGDNQRESQKSSNLVFSNGTYQQQKKNHKTNKPEE